MANLLKIKELAKEKNIAIKDLAEKVGITPQALSKLMRLGSTNTDTLERIASLLGVSAAVFFEPVNTPAELQEVDAPTAINGHHIKGNRVNDSRLLEKALDEIAEQRQLTDNALAELSRSQSLVADLVSMLKSKN